MAARSFAKLRRRLLRERGRDHAGRAHLPVGELGVENVSQAVGLSTACAGADECNRSAHEDASHPIRFSKSLRHGPGSATAKPFSGGMDSAVASMSATTISTRPAASCCIRQLRETTKRCQRCAVLSSEELRTGLAPVKNSLQQVKSRADSNTKKATSGIEPVCC